jgi:hypothetical protein
MAWPFMHEHILNQKTRRYCIDLFSHFQNLAFDMDLYRQNQRSML